MYEQVPVQQAIEYLVHIHDLYRRTTSATEKDREEYRACQAFLRRTIDNLKHGKSSLSPSTLGELSKQANLTIGGAFRLVGYPLDKLREVEFRLNGHRTRIIESYPFYRDRKIDLPEVLTHESVRRTTFVSNIIKRWQTEVPIGALRGPVWRNHDCFYMQLGAEDTELCGLPPGAIISVEPLAGNQERCDAAAIYILQLGNGYRCSRCMVSNGRLTLLPYSHRYIGRHEFLYPQDVRIVGKVRGFAAHLPIPLTQVESRRARSKAPLVLPWEQPSLSALLRTEGLRLGLNAQELERANQVLKPLIGITLSKRTLRRYQHGAETNPSTGILVALSLIHSVRFHDVLRLLGLLRDESKSYSLSTWLRATNIDDLEAAHGNAIVPTPLTAWDLLKKEWLEWPMLLSIMVPNLRKLEDRLLWIQQDEIFPGLSPFVRPGAIALVNELNGLPDTSSDRNQRTWERSIYAIRHREDIICGYLECDDEHVTLIPHPRSPARRISFLRRQIEMIGKLIAVVSPLT